MPIENERINPDENPNSLIKVLIDRVNLIPFKQKMPNMYPPDYDEIFNFQKSFFEDYDEAEWGEADYRSYNLADPADEYSCKHTDEVRCILENYTRLPLPLEFRRYILGEKLPLIHTKEDLYDRNFVITNEIWIETEKAGRRFIKFLRLRKQFRILTNLVDLIIEKNSELRLSELNYSIQEQFNETIRLIPLTIIDGLNQIQFSSRFEIDKDGRIFMNVDELTRALIGIELIRIRSCKNCKNIFWAKRLDAKCCSKKCNNVYNVLQTANKRKNNLHYEFEQLAKTEARKRAEKALFEIGFVVSDIEAYKKKFRRHPRNIITKWLSEKFLQLGNCPIDLSIPENIYQPLHDFLKLNR